MQTVSIVIAVVFAVLVVAIFTGQMRRNPPHDEDGTGGGYDDGGYHSHHGNDGDGGGSGDGGAGGDGGGD